MTSVPADVPVQGRPPAAPRTDVSGEAALPQVTGHNPGLDAVRAVAALMVLAFHVAVENGTALAPGVVGALLSTLELAVPLFFVLSGVLLYRPWAAAALDGTERPGVRSYLWRRGVRLLPAYWLVAVVALLLWSRDYLDSWVTWAQVLTLTFVYETNPWWVGTGPEGLGQMWSLCVEVAFYVTLPLFAVLLHRFAERAGTDVAARARRLLLGLALLAATSVVAMVVQFYPVERPYMHMWLPRTLCLFAAGMALAVVTEWAWRERWDGGPARRFCRTVAAAPVTCWLVGLGAYLVCASPVTGPRFAGVDGLWAALFQSGTALLFALFVVAPVACMPARAPAAATSPWAGSGVWLYSVVRVPVVRYLAKVSYGIFLWQFIVLYLWREFTGAEAFTGSFWLDIGPVTAGTVLLAAATYHWVETPSRRLNTLVRSTRHHDRGRAG